MSTLRVGAAKAVITPTEEMIQNAVFQDRSFGAVHDDLHVRALALESSGRKMVFLTFEAPDMNCSEEICAAIQEAHGIERENISLAATHSHSAPMYFLKRRTHPSDPLMEQMFDPPAEVLKQANDYAYFIIERSVEAVGKALSAARPARFGYGKGKSCINVCRDEKFENGLYGMGADLGGPSDKDLFVMKFEDMQGRLIAVIANYAVHGTCVMGKKDRAGRTNLISADIPGAISAYVENHFRQDGTICLWTSGAAGNQDPLFPSAYYSLLHDATAVKDLDPGFGQWALCEYLGQKQGRDIVRILEKIQDMKERMTVRSVEKEVSLPARRLEPGPWTREGMRADQPYQGNEIPTEPLVLKLKLITMNDVALLGMNAEIVAEIGLRLKEISPLKNLVIVEHTCERIHYLTDHSGHLRHTHTYFATRAQDGCAEEYLSAAMLDMFHERFSPENKRANG